MALKRYEGKYVILWPQYFDSSLSRKEGRRVPRELAVAKPSQRELLEVAKALGLEARPLEGRYPREWWNKEGPVLIEKKGSKREVMKLLAEGLRRRRYQK